MKPSALSPMAVYAARVKRSREGGCGRGGVVAKTYSGKNSAHTNYNSIHTSMPHPSFACSGGQDAHVWPLVRSGECGTVQGRNQCCGCVRLFSQRSSRLFVPLMSKHTSARVTRPGPRLFVRIVLRDTFFVSRIFPISNTRV